MNPAEADPDAPPTMAGGGGASSGLSGGGVSGGAGEDGEEPGARWGGGEEGGGGVWLSDRADLARALSETQAALETSEHRFMEEPFQIRTSFQVHLRFSWYKS